MDEFLDNVDDEEDFPGRLLHQAALWENQELLEDLLNGDQIAYINSRDTRGRTALHAAVANESQICTRILLQAGADPNMCCNLKHGCQTPLHVAAKHGRVENIKLLVEWKADLLAKDKHGFTALDIADQCRHEECMEVLKEAAAEKEQLRKEIYIALLETSSRGDAGKMRSLLREFEQEASFVINSAPNGSNTILFKASEEGQKEIVKLLIEYGADGRIHPVTKYSPLYIACYSGRKDIAEILLKRFPQLVQMATVERWLPIHAAAINGHAAILEMLLKFPYPSHVMQTFRYKHDKHGTMEYQLPFDINARDVTGQTVLYLACYVGNQKLVELLLKLKVKAVKIDTKEDYSNENSEEATNKNSTAHALDRKWESDTKSDGDTSPKRKLSGGIQMIISKLNLNRNGDQGLRPNECMINPLDLDIYCSNETETALHVAVKNKHHLIATLLLANGANPNLKINISEDDTAAAYQDDDCTFTGSTALVEACKNTDYPMIDLLLRHGARDDECKALVIAIRQQDEVTVSKLLALKTHPDPEYKINKKALDGIPATQFGSLGFAGVGNVTYSSLFPTVPVMVNWHGQKCLDHIREQWLIEASISHNTKLKLNVKNQSISLAAITRLDISNNAIAELPGCIFQLVSLKHLNAAQNKIERLPPGCSKVGLQIPSQTKTSKSDLSELVGQYECASLEEIHLQDNRLESIPAALFNLPSLVILDLSNNKLQSLPFKMWTAPKLRELNLSFNLLCDMPVRTKTAFETRFTKDYYEDVRTPEQACSPRHMSSSPQLRREDGNGGRGAAIIEICQDNVKYCLAEEADGGKRLSKCSESSSYGGSNLISKELHHNNLWSHNIEINDNVLNDDENNKDSQSQLTSLNLAHNSFERVPAGLACLAVNLARLNLSYNRLTEMGHISFYPIGLKQLDLSHNQVHSWPTIRRYDSDLMLESPNCYSSYDTSPKHTNKADYVSLYKISQPSRSGTSSPLTTLGNNLCVHRRHNRLDNLRTLILADNGIDRLVISSDDDIYGMCDDDEPQEPTETSSNSNKLGDLDFRAHRLLQVIRAQQTAPSAAVEKWLAWFLVVTSAKLRKYTSNFDSPVGINVDVDM